MTLLEDGEAKPKQFVLYEATDGSDCVLLWYGLTLIRQTKPTWTLLKAQVKCLIICVGWILL